MARRNGTALTLYDSVNPLYRLSRIFQISPYRRRNGKIVGLCKLDKLISSVYIIVIIVSIFWTNYGQLNFSCDADLKLPCIVDIIFTFPIFVLIVFSIALTTLKSDDKLLEFYRKLSTLDKFNFTLEELEYANFLTILVKNIALTYVLATLLSVPDVIVTVIELGISRASYFFSLNFSYYYILLIVFQITTPVVILLRRFKILNKHLKSFQTVYVHHGKLFIVMTKPRYLRNLGKVHSLLCDLIENFNQIHGIQIVLIHCSIISLALLCFNYTLWSEDFLSNYFKDKRYITAFMIMKITSVVFYIVVPGNGDYQVLHRGKKRG
ncbi:hypothetical protein FQA39_LY11486 [Lamprigera yunnana]|nr:hypothetical protein FQA39_LY11486 [Lamprigera yunnana]